MREIRTSGSMRGRRKRTTMWRACVLLYANAPQPLAAKSEKRRLHFSPGASRQMLQLTSTSTFVTSIMSLSKDAALCQRQSLSLSKGDFERFSGYQLHKNHLEPFG